MLATLVVLALAIPADPPKEKELSAEAQKELKKLEGKWKLVKEITADGENEPEGVLEFKGRKMVMEAREMKVELEVIALDPTTHPKCIDLKALVEIGPIPKGTVIEAIYKLDGDTLMLAGYTGAAKKRPANFDPPKDEATDVWVLKRVKE